MHTSMFFCTPLKEKWLDSMIKLIAIDMDGTLLDSQKRFLQRILKLFKKQLRQVSKLSFVQDAHVQVFFRILRN